METLNKEQTFISNVVYVHNNENTINSFLIKLHNFMNDKFENFEIILVNNYSNDKTYNNITKLDNKYKKNLTLINLPWKHKKEIAMLCGIDITIGDLIYEIEGVNIDYSIELLDKLFEKTMDGYDIVSATPKNRTKLSSRIFYNLINRLSHIKLNLSTESVRIISRRTINFVTKTKQRVIYRKALYLYSGYDNANIIYEPVIENKKTSDVSFKEKFNIALDLLLSLSDISINITWIISLIFIVISLIGGAYALVAHLIFDVVISGWTTIILFLSFGFSGLFFILGLISKYLYTILIEVQNKSYYTIKSIERFVEEEEYKNIEQ